MVKATAPSLSPVVYVEALNSMLGWAALAYATSRSTSVVAIATCEKMIFVFIVRRAELLSAASAPLRRLSVARALAARSLHYMGIRGAKLQTKRGCSLSFLACRASVRAGGDGLRREKVGALRVWTSRVRRAPPCPVPGDRWLRGSVRGRPGPCESWDDRGRPFDARPHRRRG